MDFFQRHRQGSKYFSRLIASTKLRYVSARGAMQKTENFTGITGVSEQDGAIQDSQGYITDRTRELLGPTDIGVVQFRRLMLAAAKDLGRGIEPAWAAHPEAYRVRAGGIVAPDHLSFEAVMLERFGDPQGRPGTSSP